MDVTDVPEATLGPCGDVVSQIRTAIVEGRFVAGQRLVEVDLVNEFDAHRADVRLALVVLAHEGFVERSKHRGASVVRVSVDGATEVAKLRGVIEGLCASQAAQHMTPDRVRALEDLGGDMRDAVERAEFVTYSGLNRRLHRLIRTYAANATADHILDRLPTQIGVSHEVRLALHPVRARASLAEHMEIIRAIAGEDSDGAEAAMRAHLASVAVNIAAVYELASSHRVVTSSLRPQRASSVALPSVAGGSRTARTEARTGGSARYA